MSGDGDGHQGWKGAHLEEGHEAFLQVPGQWQPFAAAHRTALLAYGPSIPGSVPDVQLPGHDLTFPAWIACFFLSDSEGEREYSAVR